MTTATWQHHAFKIGDAKDIDLFGQAIVNSADMTIGVTSISSSAALGQIQVPVGKTLYLGGNSTAIEVQSDGVLIPVKAPTATAPTAVLGGIYFDTTLNKLRVCESAGSWRTVTTT